MAIGASPNPDDGNKLPPRTAPKDVRRQQLIEATIESIAQHGVSGTTMKTVTGIAGLSMGIVNFHFQNKETLFRDTLIYLAEEHRKAWRDAIADDSMPPAKKLLAIADAHFAPHVCNRPRLAVWFGFYGEAANRAAYREIMADVDDERWHLHRTVCQQIIDEGDYSHKSAQAVSDLLESIYDGFWLNILLYPKEFSPDLAKTRVRNTLTDIFPRHYQHHAA